MSFPVDEVLLSDVAVDRVVSGRGPYHDRILRQPVISRRLQDRIFGQVNVDDITFSVADADALLKSYYPGVGMRGFPMTHRRYDLQTGFLQTVWTGVVSRVQLDNGIVHIDGSSLNRGDLETEIPRGTLTTTDFPLAAEPDLGKVFPVIFGNRFKVTCLYVKKDLVNSIFHYIVGRGALTVTAVFRDGPNDTFYPVGVGEYSVSTSLYPGFTTLIFPLIQRNFQGADHVIYADVQGLQPERNFARAIRSVLSDQVWGLGKPVKTSTFDTAEAQLNTIGGLLCDGLMASPQQAQFVLRQLMMARLMRIWVDEDGEYAIAVDTLNQSVKMVVGAGPGDGPRNITSVGIRTTSTIDEAVKTLNLHFGRHGLDGEMKHVVSRPVLSFGKVIDEDFDFALDATTVDKIVDFTSKRMRDADDTLGLTLNHEGRTLIEADLIQVTAPEALVVGEVREVLEVTHEEDDSVSVLTAGRNPDSYVYIAGPLPPAEQIVNGVEIGQVAPAPPTLGSVVSSGIRDAADTGIEAWMIVQCTTPAENYTAIRVDIKAQGQTVYTKGAAWYYGEAPSAVVQMQLSGLTPGVIYDIAFIALNASDLESVPLLLGAQPAPADLRTPATPGTPTLQSQYQRTATFVWTASGTAPIPVDAEYQLRTAAGGGGTLVKSGPCAVKSHTLTVDGIIYSTPYFFRVRVRTASNVFSFWSGDASVTFTQVVTGEIFDAAITTAKIGLLAVDTARIADASITTAKIALLAVTSAQIANATITQAKIANLAVGTAQIIDASITTAKIALLAVTSAQIANATITQAKIANLAVGTAQIIDAAITTAKIALLAVGSAQIADAAITNAKIGTAAITNAKIGNLEVDSAKIANLTIGTGKIALNAVTQLTGSFLANPVSLVVGSYTQLRTIAVTSLGGVIEIQGASVVAILGASGVVPNGARMRIRNSNLGTVSYEAVIQAPAGGIDITMTLITIMVEQPAAGSYTYILEAIATGISGATVIQAYNNGIFLKEFKR